ncbi:hypothetical protein L6164_032708 [Bauhinia variegata]|uniref:Uncharacterized protein n=1 Tax=Bauhinia variegata TaxID=167791 RepID=A0ACB9KPM4_BAUVA|nr:hypothetical protein L6164_032708 [Bauhinia variegata]
MALETIGLSVVLIRTFFWALFTLSLFMAAGYGTETDIYCLRSIKESLEDTNGILSSSWNFTNNTEGFICTFTGVECWHPDANRVLSLKLSDISKFAKFVTSLDLSNNKFSGEIPEDIANCIQLNALELDDNQLSGEIPPRLTAGLAKIKAFTVANNYLTGPVPTFKEGVASADSYANNRGLCGWPWVPCPKSSEDFKDGAVVGFSFSITSVVVIYLCYFVPWEQLRKNKNKKRPNERKYQLRSQVCDPDAKFLEKERKEVFYLSFAAHTTNLLQSPYALSDTIDKCLIGKGFEDEIFSLLTIACDCVQILPEERPTMPEIYNRMSNLWGRHGQSEDSEMPKKSAIASVGTRGDEIVELE